jgi:KaiC/GvpD/RAD55 family RecA-like ATPase
MARARVPTGIEGLDEMLQGGLPQGKSYLISGEPGTGKTTFSAQFILEGLRRGENGIYISVDEKPAHVVEDAESLGWDLRTPVESGKLTLLDVSPYFNWVRQGKNNQIDTNEVIQDLSKQIRRINAKRLVFDSIVPLVLHRERVHDVQEFIRELIFSIDDNMGCTTLMTSHIWPGALGTAEHSVEEFLVSGVIQLRLVRADGGRFKRACFVRKMRATPVELREYVFEIQHRNGIVIKEPLDEQSLNGK